MRAALILLLVAVLPILAQDPTPNLVDRLQQEALAYAEAQSVGSSGTFTFRVIRPPTLPQLRAGTVRFEPSHTSKRELSGNFFVVFKVLVDSRPTASVRVDLEGHWKGRLLRTKAPLAAKVVPSEDQLETFEFEGPPPPGAIMEFPSGFRLRSPIASGHILTRSDLQAIPLINAGDRVRVELQCGPLSVTSESVARSTAAMGEKVRLELLTNHRNLQAIVTGSGEARVKWGNP